MGRRWDIAEWFFKEKDGWMLVIIPCMLIIIISLLALASVDPLWGFILHLATVFIIALIITFFITYYLFMIISNFIDDIVYTYEYEKKLELEREGKKAKVGDKK